MTGEAALMAKERIAIEHFDQKRNEYQNKNSNSQKKKKLAHLEKLRKKYDIRDKRENHRYREQNDEDSLDNKFTRSLQEI